MISISLLNKNNKNNDQWEKIEVNNWNPKSGESIEGKLIQIKYISEHKVYVIKSSANKIVQIWGRTYLDQLMEEIQINDYIRVTYTGTQKTMNERYMKRFNVERRIKND